MPEKISKTKETNTIRYTNNFSNSEFIKKYPTQIGNAPTKNPAKIFPKINIKAETNKKVEIFIPYCFITNTTGPKYGSKIVSPSID